MVPKLPVREQKIDQREQVGFIYPIPSTQQCVRHKVGAQLLFEGGVDEERKKGGGRGKGKRERVGRRKRGRREGSGRKEL